MAPPTTGPAIRARPVTPLKMPSALPRRSGGNAALSSAIASGMISAAPGALHGAGGDQPADARRPWRRPPRPRRTAPSPTTNIRRAAEPVSERGPVSSSTAKLRL